MFDKMKQLYEMQRKAQELQKQLENIKFEKVSKDGFLRVSVNGANRVESVTVGTEYLNPDKKTGLERALKDLTNEALNEVQKQAAAQAASLMRDMPNPWGSNQ